MGVGVRVGGVDGGILNSVRMAVWLLAGEWDGGGERMCAGGGSYEMFNDRTHVW